MKFPEGSHLGPVCKTFFHTGSSVQRTASLYYLPSLLKNYERLILNTLYIRPDYSTELDIWDHMGTICAPGNSDLCVSFPPASAVVVNTLIYCCQKNFELTLQTKEFSSKN